MFDQAILNNVLGKGFDFMGIADSPKNGQDKRYNKIKSFLLKSNFSGFTKDDLFIMQFIKKGWGHDIAALSNMAEAFMNFSHSNPAKIPEYQQLLSEVVFRALHPKVNPYKKDIKNVKYLGKYGSIKSEDVVKKIFDNSFVHSWSSDNLLKITKMCDVAIIPINLKNKLTLGKPENKLLLFWRMGIPTIVSATPSYVRAMNKAGIASFVHNTENEWIESIENVINNEKYRESVGSLGRKYVTERYNSDAIIKQWDRVFNSIGFNSIT